MLSGKRFVIGKPTLALEATADGKRGMVTLPTGAIISVLSGPSTEGDIGTVSVEWQGRKLAMFAIDLKLRGTEKRAGA